MVSTKKVGVSHGGILLISRNYNLIIRFESILERDISFKILKPSGF